jgi:hypothetical protein
MSETPAVPEALAREERRLRIVKTFVLGLACFVGLTLVTAAVFAIYSNVTDRPAKAMFGLS